MKKKGLGKGLLNLLEEELAPKEGDEFLYLDVELIKPNPYQPRTKFDEASLKELSDSIKQNGMLQPIVVMPAENGYILLAGERRWRAAMMAGVTKVPALVKKVDEEKAAEISLIENLLREDLTPLEVANSLESLRQRLSLTHEELAERIGLDRSTVTNFLRLLKLPAPIKEALHNGEINMGQAKALLSIDDPQLQLKAFEYIKKHNLNVREVEKLVANLKKSDGRPEKDPDLKRLEERLSQALSTRVEVNFRKRSGFIKIYCRSLKDFERIISYLEGKDEETTH